MSYTKKERERYASLRVVDQGGGEWRAYHSGLGVSRIGKTRKAALENTARAVELVRKELG